MFVSLPAVTFRVRELESSKSRPVPPRTNKIMSMTLARARVLPGCLPLALVTGRRCSHGGADTSSGTRMSRRSLFSQIPGGVLTMAAADVELVTSTMPCQH